MSFGIVKAHYNGTIKLIHAFQEKAGLPDHKAAVNAILFLNQNMVRDAADGLVYSASDTKEERLSLPELYQSHVAQAREDDRWSDIMMAVQGVDPVALRSIGDYMAQNGARPKGVAEALKVATTVATTMYDRFGSGKTGELHIPAFYPDRPQIGHTHMYLKVS